MEVSLSGNEATRFAVIEAIGEQGVFHINNTQFRTVDRIVRDGKVYSDKPLPLGVSAGLLHKAVHTVTGLNFKDNYHLLIYLYNIICGGLVNILIFVWLFNHLRRYRKGSVQKKFLLALSAGLGSWLLSYSVTINNHTPAALALLGWFIALEKFSRKPVYSTAVIAGLASGAATAFDMPIGFFACIINLFVLFFAGKTVNRETLLTCIFSCRNRRQKRTEFIQITILCRTEKECPFAPVAVTGDNGTLQFFQRKFRHLLQRR